MIRPTWLRITALCVFIVSGCWLIHKSSRRNTRPIASFAFGTDAKSCIASPSGERIVVSVKTGATVAKKIITLAQTALQCSKNVLFFLDLEQDIAEYHLYDALDTIAPSVTEGNTDFDFYRKQQELWNKEQNVDTFQGYKRPGSEYSAAWILDKYKNIHIVEMTWALKPDMDWYIFVDADTYLIWSNLLIWLETLDPSKVSYFGSDVSAEGLHFAHGGSGIILSNAAMRLMTVTNNDTALRWDPKTKGNCCGDYMLGLALKDYGVELQDVFPLISGESPRTIPFGPGTPEYWCYPTLSMHHLAPPDMEELSNFKKRMSRQDPVVHAELFRDFILPSLPTERTNWDNIADDRGEFGKTGGVSSETSSSRECADRCEADKQCFQYSHHGNTCNIGMSVRLGNYKEADEKGMWTSGWHKTRLSQWLEQQPKCDFIGFPGQAG